MQVFIYTRTEQQARELDEQLWTFKSDSFIPHCVIFADFFSDSKAKSDNFNYPVLIKAADTNDDTIMAKQGSDWSENNFPDKSFQDNALLINLSRSIPAFIQHFERIAEMVDKDEDEKQQARARYRIYRQQGHTINKYDL